MKRLLLSMLSCAALAVPAAYAADSGAPAATDPVNVQYRDAVVRARAGETAVALTALRPLVERFPQRQDMLGDYAVILGLAGDHAAAVELLARIDLAAAPSHVIEGVAASARALRQYALAETLYGEAIARFPQRAEPRIGLARTLADDGKLEDAAAQIDKARAAYPHRVDVLEAGADIAKTR
ncbi:MAG: tetratricopeptide repeat protein [Burkholderiales bacterium]